MADAQVTISDLIHRHRQVLSRLQRERRMTVTRDGVVVAIMTAPDEDHQQMDEWAAAGLAHPDWRERQEKLWDDLLASPTRTSSGSLDTAGTDAILADREETDR
ncbi:hypothetical protein [Saccharopolyspora cebuensis]|uniref:Antitoxin n=1 Tax=Saccharopolyspora cebuensis TaxID=418759 RepID=A0ABV4CJ12_9PSEU